MAREKGRASACYMAGVLQAVYDSGDLTKGSAENVNERLEADGLENVTIDL